VQYTIVAEGMVKIKKGKEKTNKQNKKWIKKEIFKNIFYLFLILMETDEFAVDCRWWDGMDGWMGAIFKKFSVKTTFKLKINLVQNNLNFSSIQPIH
jgi:hypothetical protein